MSKIIIANAFSINMLASRRAWKIEFSQLDIDVLKKWISESTSTVESYIGHADTARVVSEILSVPLAENRQNYQFGILGDNLIVAQYSGPRLPEGATSLPEDARIVFWSVEISPHQ